MAHLEHAAHRRLRRTVQLLTLISVVLAALCVAMAYNWRKALRTADCWRAEASEGDYAQGRHCDRR